MLRRCHAALLMLAMLAGLASAISGIDSPAGSMSDAVVDVYPADTFWTGGVYYIPSWPYWGFWWENPITWGNFFWMTTPCNERGFARYDVSPIPDRATVTSAVVHYFVYWDTLDAPAEIHLLTVEPHPDSEEQAQEIYAAIATGTVVATVEVTSAGWNDIALYDDACRAIEQASVTTDWFGLGWLYPGADSADAAARGWRSDSLKTYLTVSYELTGVGEALREASPVPRFTIAPNPSSGEVALIRCDATTAGGVLSIYDAGGRRVHRQVLDAVRSASCVTLRLAGLAPGVYSVELKKGRTSAAQKLVVR